MTAAERDRALALALAALHETLAESVTDVGRLAVEVTNGGATALLAALAVGLTHALTDVDAVATLCGEAAAEVGQLQTALTARVVIEQAKGVLAERAGITTDVAWLRLRNFARNRNRRAHDVASALVDGSLPAAEVALLMEALP